jgi:6-phosphofructokinase 1
VAAIDAVHLGAWGQMVALRNNEMLPVPLTEAMGGTRTVDMHLYHEVAEVFFG